MESSANLKRLKGNHLPSKKGSELGKEIGANRTSYTRFENMTERNHLHEKELHGDTVQELIQDFNCGYCNKSLGFDVVHSKITWGSDKGDDWIAFGKPLVILKCRYCELNSMAVFEVNGSEEHRNDYYYLDNDPNVIYLSPYDEFILVTVHRMSLLEIYPANHNNPPEEPTKSKCQNVLPLSVVKDTRGYIEKVVNQINATYESNAYDASAVMIRKLVETLIIETFESKKIDHKIKNSNGDFFYLKDLIRLTLAESTWNLGRNTKAALPRLKNVGDMSAHNRRYLAQKRDIDKLIPDLRVVSQELLLLSGLK